MDSVSQWGVNYGRKSEILDLTGYRKKFTTWDKQLWAKQNAQIERDWLWSSKEFCFSFYLGSPDIWSYLK